MGQRCSRTERRRSVRRELRPASRGEEAGSRRRYHQLAVWFALGALITLWIGLRVFPANELVLRQDGTTRLLDTDSYYHLRHIQSIVEHYPRLQRWDAGTHFPHGQRSMATGLFDLSIATAALIAGAGAPSSATIERVAAMAPIAVSSLALFSLFLLVRRASGPFAGLGAVALTVLVPGELAHRASLGFADHHVAEVLLLVLSLLGWCTAFEERGSDPTNVGAGRGQLERLRLAAEPWLRAALAASPMAAFVFTWAGAPLYLAVLAVSAWVAMSVAVGRSAFEASRARPLARYGVALAVLVAGPAVLIPSLVLVERVVPAVVVGSLAMAAAFRAVEWLLGWFERHGIGSPGRAAVLLALAVLALLVTALDPIVQAVIWSGSAKAQIVREQKEVTLALLWNRLGLLPLLAVASMPLTLLDPDRKRIAPFLSALTAVAFLALSWRSRDYGYVIAPLCAAAVALGLAAVLRRRRPVPLAFGLLSLLTVLLLSPFALGSSGRPWVSKAKLARLVALDDATERALSWMRTHTPVPPLGVTTPVPAWEDDFDYPSGSYGVISSWENGNFVAAIGRRVPVHSQGVSKRIIRWMLERDEAKSVELWSRLGDPGERVRYVVLDATTVTNRFPALAGVLGTRISTVSPPNAKDLLEPGPNYTASMAARLYVAGGNGLSRYRLIHDSPEESLLFYRRTPSTGTFGIRSVPLDDSLPEALSLLLRHDRPVRAVDATYYHPVVRPTLRIFEIVRGATIRGRAPPGASVQAALRLRRGTRRVDLVYVWERRAEVDGRYEIVVPYATTGAQGDISAVGPYELLVTMGDQELAKSLVAVSESDVQSGAGVDADASRMP